MLRKIIYTVAFVLIVSAGYVLPPLILSDTPAEASQPAQQKVNAIHLPTPSPSPSIAAATTPTATPATAVSKIAAKTAEKIVTQQEQSVRAEQREERTEESFEQDSSPETAVIDEPQAFALEPEIESSEEQEDFPLEEEDISTADTNDPNDQPLEE